MKPRLSSRRFWAGRVLPVVAAFLGALSPCASPLGVSDSSGPSGSLGALGSASPVFGKTGGRAGGRSGGLHSQSSDKAVWAKVALAVGELLEKQHYLRRPLDHQFSNRALELYLETLDPERLYFLQPDVDEFQRRFGGGFASALREGSFEAVEAVHARYVERFRMFCETVSGLAGGEWDFSTQWSTDLSRERAVWPADEGQALALWTAQVGAELLQGRLEGADASKTVAQLRKRVSGMLKMVVEGDLKDRVAPALLALARAGDAHSDYLTQEEFEDTESEIRLTRIGIGVTLDEDPAGLRVSALTPGGPAQRDGRLRVNDKIVAVAEEVGPFHEVDGVPFSQAIGWIRGKKGSMVRLKIQPARATDPAQRQIVGIRRDEMRSVEGEAYAKIVEHSDPGTGVALRMGWLVVPGFYGEDMVEISKRKSSVSRDVALLLKRLEAEKVAGVVLDFRGNLGGLLDEAVEVGGLFCGRVPIAQVRVPDEEIEVLQPVRLRTAAPVYGGPLVVVTDRGSASASELVAAALQDYGRAIVVGGEQTFGKGSVQTTVSLAEYLGSRQRLRVGGMALTIGKFYRVNGQSTQILGVRPDIVLPSTLDLPFEGESALTNPLAHDSVSPLVRSGGGRISMRALTEIGERSAQRVAGSEAFAAVAAERDAARKERRENRLSLEERERRENLEALHRAFTERETAMEGIRFGMRFCRLLLEDVKLKRLSVSEADPLASRDPESVATESEVLRILVDLIQSGETSVKAKAR